MKLKTVSVTYGRKQNLGDFNSANISCTFWADLEEGDNEADVMENLWSMAKNNVKKQLLPLVDGSNEKIENIFMGLPLEVRNSLETGENNDAN